MLRRVSGPECPTCGCCAGEDLGRSGVGDRQSVRRRCDHCGAVWSYVDEAATVEPDESSPADRGVVYHVMRCPNCASEDTVVTSTQRPLRYHKCRECGQAFKSVEK